MQAIQHRAQTRLFRSGSYAIRLILLTNLTKSCSRRGQTLQIGRNGCDQGAPNTARVTHIVRRRFPPADGLRLARWEHSTGVPACRLGRHVRDHHRPTRGSTLTLRGRLRRDARSDDAPEHKVPCRPAIGQAVDTCAESRLSYRIAPGST